MRRIAGLVLGCWLLISGQAWSTNRTGTALSLEVTKTRGLQTEISRGPAAGRIVAEGHAAQVRHRRPVVRLRQTPQSALAPLPVPGPDSGDGVDSRYARLLGYGWQEYKLGNGERAVFFFTEAAKSTNPEISRQASIGLAYAEMRCGHRLRALALFSELTRSGTVDSGVLDTLAGLLVDSGQFAQAHDLLARMDPVARKKWRQRLEEIRFQRQTADLKEMPPERALALIRDNWPLVDKCGGLEGFFKLAEIAARQDREQALALIQALSRCRPRDRHWQERLLARRFSLLSDDRLVALAGRGDLPDGDRKILAGILWERVAQSPPDSDQRAGLITALERAFGGEAAA